VGGARLAVAAGARVGAAARAADALARIHGLRTCFERAAHRRAMDGEPHHRSALCGTPPANAADVRAALGAHAGPRRRRSGGGVRARTGPAPVAASRRERGRARPLLARRRLVRAGVLAALAGMAGVLRSRCLCTSGLPAPHRARRAATAGRGSPHQRRPPRRPRGSSDPGSRLRARRGQARRRSRGGAQRRPLPRGSAGSPRSSEAPSISMGNRIARSA